MRRRPPKSPRTDTRLPYTTLVRWLGGAPGDPVAVARDGLAWARERQHDVIVVDTAGRLGVDAEMMQQAADIRDAVEPDEILFVVDAMIGQDAVDRKSTRLNSSH